MALFGNLTERLNTSLGRIAGRGRITESNVADTLREVRIALLEADVALPVVKKFLGAVRERALGSEVAKSLSPSQAFIKILSDELTQILASGDHGLNLRVRPPAVLVLAGLQGSGKTTTAAKLAYHLKGAGKKVVLVSTDLQRPAAVDQLKILAEQVGVGFVLPESRSSTDVAKAALQSARLDVADVLIVDTAGRLHVDNELMAELRLMVGDLDPVEVLFVADAMTGQDAVRSASAFDQSLPLTGVILTKADGDARGGAALSIAHVTGRPIKFVGTGEKVDKLEAFDPKRMASRILGMGDIVGLAESVARDANKERSEKLARKLHKGKGFDLEDFRDQLEQVAKLGGANALLDRLPRAMRLADASTGALDDGVLRRQVAIINSMTPRERRHPAIINGSRRRRIATGSGVAVQDVNRLLRQHAQAQKLMKKFKRGGMNKALGMLGGRLPPGLH